MSVAQHSKQGFTVSIFWGEREHLCEAYMYLIVCKTYITHVPSRDVQEHATQLMFENLQRPNSHSIDTKLLIPGCFQIMPMTILTNETSLIAQLKHYRGFPISRDGNLDWYDSNETWLHTTLNKTLSTTNYNGANSNHIDKPTLQYHSALQCIYMYMYLYCIPQGRKHNKLKTYMQRQPKRRGSPNPYSCLAGHQSICITVTQVQQQHQLTYYIHDALADPSSI